VLNEAAAIMIAAAYLLAPQVEGLCGGSSHEDVISILLDELHKSDTYDI
jgi:hypothetical protein